ncbi:phosphoribosylanthranilate isomerase [Halodesulfovibrio marinisediminis]|uniref:N-(5'-phosphoribosyl)anthranilate isomerase n=1 Tax=Halodesulfovibrio marinisediminis DSM 17456 TaxID=1121457 RepID=A0A1N6HJT4_9BACT|nr:phosphoribosylanthranilate isomerase [Halodesulfovibrio marinisediminis]SIO19996.1 phosphoribosylanthranilate isomerase [Halodesulfovibrio marinisediminis DSM 17456]
MLNKHSKFNSLTQIAGVHDTQETLMLADCGVHCVGLPLRLPVNKEDITEDEARTIIRETRNKIIPVCITYLDHAEDIMQFCRELDVAHVQLHGHIELEELQKLARIAPHLYIIKSLVVQADGSNKEALLQAVTETAPFVDAYITDTHNPKNGADGATGLTHDWSISAQLVQHSPHPVILAGGLNPENVANAIRTVKPAGVDAHTGVEDSTGRKNKALVCKFASEAAKAFAELTS